MFEDNLNQNIARPELLQIAESVAREKSIDQNIVIPVSYTHLTLPTICSV